MPSSNHEDRLYKVLLAYLEEVDAGRSVDRSEFIESHPEFAGELAQFFNSHDQMEGLAGPLRSVAQFLQSGVRSSETPWPGADVETTLPISLFFPGQPFGDYDLLGEIGFGGMGVVYKARQKSLNRLVAIKMIRAAGSTSDVDLRRFRNEAKAVAALDHPNIIPIYEIGEFRVAGPGPPITYFSMKLIDGPNLAHQLYLYREDLHAAAGLLAVVARAINHAHQQGILHRDLKPANVLLRTEEPSSVIQSQKAKERSEAGQKQDAAPVSEIHSLSAPRFLPVITDFGLAKRLSDDESGLSQPGEHIGTPSYMAPEQATRDIRPLTTAADVYGLGAILYAMITGRPPFRADTIAETIRLVLETNPTPPRQLNPNVDRDLEAICLKCLSKNPESRYPSALALAEELERWQRGEPILARPPSASGRLWRWCRRNRLAAALLLTAAALLVSGVTGLLLALFVIYGKQAQLERQRDEANKQRAIAIKHEKIIRLELYAAEMNLAERAWRHGDLDGMRKLLVKYEPRTGSGDDIRGFGWHYLRGLLDRYPVKAWVGRSHQGGVFTVAFSPDGRLLASAGHDGVIRLWEPGTGRELPYLGKHGEEINQLAFVPDGRFLATVSNDSTAKLWDLAEHRLRHTFSSHRGEVSCLAVSANGKLLATGGVDRRICLWQIESGKQLDQFGPVAGALKALSFFEESAIIYTCDRTPKLGCFDLASREQRPFPFIFPDRLSIAKVLPSGIAVAGCDDGEIAILGDLRPGHSTSPQFFHDHDTKIHDLAFSPDYRMVASARDDGTVFLQDTCTGAQDSVLQGHTHLVMAVQFSPSGRMLATASRDGTVSLWKLPSNRSHSCVLVASPPVLSEGLSPDGRFLARCSAETPSRVYIMERDPDHTTFRQLLPVLDCPGIQYAALGPNAKMLALVSGYSVKLLDLESRQFRAPAGNLPPDELDKRVAFSPDGKCFGFVLANKSIRLIFLGSQRQSTIPGASDSPIFTFAFSGDGTTVAVAHENGSLGLWDIQREQYLHLVPAAHGLRISSLAFSADGGTLATGSLDATVKLWDVATGEKLSSLSGIDGPVNALSFAPDYGTLVVAVKDRVTLWHPAGRSPMVELRVGPESAIRWLLFPAEENVLMALSEARNQHAVDFWWGDQTSVPQSP
jgi:WD40 repeat protein/serine/threonine protein kinase